MKRVPRHSIYSKTKEQNIARPERLFSENYELAVTNAGVSAKKQQPHKGVEGALTLAKITKTLQPSHIFPSKFVSKLDKIRKTEKEISYDFGSFLTHNTLNNIR